MPGSFMIDETGVAACESLWRASEPLSNLSG